MRLRLATKAKIKRASIAARNRAGQLDKAALTDLLEIYTRARAELQDKILRYGSPITQGLRLESMQLLLNEISVTLDNLARVERTALFERMRELAVLGIEPVAELMGAARAASLVDDAVLASRHFVAADGLQLADRLWRNNRHAREVVSRSIQNAIIQGMSASDAAQDFLSRGQDIPADVVKKMSVANAGAVARKAGSELMTAEGAPYRQAKRVFRTEINRAHGMAYQAGIAEVEGAVGTRYLLGANHPRPDICDMHSRVNLHGLGPGVYPHGRSPWPAHPNTLSFEVIVFEDEVTASDKTGRQSRIDWLKSSPAELQRLVLNSRMKQRALTAGVLRENQIATPWNILKARYARQGIEIPAPVTPPLPIRSGRSSVVSAPSERNPFATRRLEAAKTKKDAITEIERFANRVELSTRSGTLPLLNSMANAFHVVLGKYNVRLNRVGFIGRRHRRANGVYYTRPMGEIELRSSYYKDQFDTSKGLGYQAGRRNRIDSLKRRIDANEPGSLTSATLKRNLDLVEAAERWSFSSVAEDAVFSTTAHESGHALYFQGLNIQSKFADNLDRNNVAKIDWFRVSEYAGTNEQELFAEVTTAFAQGLERMIPDNVANAYLDTLEGYQVAIELQETFSVAI